MSDRGDVLRQLPSVDRLAVSVARAVLAERRAELLRERPATDGELTARELTARATPGEDIRSSAVTDDELTERALARLRPSLRRVLNATGVIVHTNLGRAPLAAAARAAVARAACGYSNLELDLESGRRGSRNSHVESLLCELTGAESALVVNNCAGAVLLAAAALAAGGELIVSRGQLVEIGGRFRIPDVVAQAGARLVEVGTTNRTRLSDYRAALGADGCVILRVHQSNFRTLGFVESVPVEPLCRLGMPVIDDIGSGLLAQQLPLCVEEPEVRRSVAAGAALVCFSGDKLLGGPQAGILVGRAAAVANARRHPLARALRIDKLSLAALAATLALYRDPEAARRELPVLAMLSVTEDELLERAQALACACAGELVRSSARVGGGALPLLELEGPAVALGPRELDPAALARTLRLGEPALIGRISHGRLLLDPRTLAPGEVAAAGAAARAALERWAPERWAHAR